MQDAAAAQPHIYDEADIKENDGDRGEGDEERFKVHCADVGYVSYALAWFHAGDTRATRRERG